MNEAAKKTTLGVIGVGALFAWQAGSAQTAAGASDADAKMLQPIIVTAQKRREDIQTVPLSIGVIDEKQLADLHATQLADYAAYIPGFQIQSLGTPGQASLSVRGITPLGSSATVATYIDDTPLGSSSLYGTASANTLDLLPFDFQSFDVLRGPQGTLYGASALGGLIKYVTKAPDLNNLSVVVGADTFNIDGAGKYGVDGRIRINVPLVSDQLGFTASFSRQNTPGYIDNAQTGIQDQNSYYQQGGRVALLWKPNDDISLTVSAIQQKINAESASYVALNTASLQPIYGKLQDNNYVPEPYTSTLNYFTAALDWNFGWADFVSATSYSETKMQSVLDASLTYGVLFPLFGQPTGISAFTAVESLYKTTQEFRLTSKPSDRFEWLAGAFYTDETSSQNQVASAQMFDGAPLPGFDPLATIALPSTYKEYALFGDATYKFTGSFDITGGFRWAHNDQTFTQVTGGAIEPVANVPGSSSQGVWTYSVSPSFRINANTMLYARVATGYQPGGPNVALPNVPPSVASDTVTNYEVGLKSEFYDHRVLVDVDAFYIDWHDIQVGATNGVTSYIVNGGTARSEGVEFSTLYTPIQGLRLGLNAAYTEAILTQDVPSISGLSGDTLPYIPRWAGSATADYSFPLVNNWTGRVGGGWRYTGHSETAPTSSPQALLLRSYDALDLNAGVSNDRWTMRLFVKNAANKVAYINELPIMNAATGATTEVRGVPLQPRTVGVGLEAKF